MWVDKATIRNPTIQSILIDGENPLLGQFEFVDSLQVFDLAKQEDAGYLAS